MNNSRRVFCLGLESCNFYRRHKSKFRDSKGGKALLFLSGRLSIQMTILRATITITTGGDFSFFDGNLSRATNWQNLKTQGFFREITKKTWNKINFFALLSGPKVFKQKLTKFGPMWVLPDRPLSSLGRRESRLPRRKQGRKLNFLSDKKSHGLVECLRKQSKTKDGRKDNNVKEEKILSSKKKRNLFCAKCPVSNYRKTFLVTDNWKP